MTLLTDLQSKVAARIGSWRQPSTLVAVVATLVVAYLYVFFASSGRLYFLNHQTSYYNLLAEGLRAGHLHLSVEPSPELLAKSDPLDFSNVGLWLWDLTLFKGHYYLYWGPVPAILLAIFKTVLRINRDIQDAYLAGFFVFARFLVGAMLIRAMASEFYARASSWTTWLAIALWAFANPIPYFLSRGAVYEAAIAAGQFFFLAGVYCAFRSLYQFKHPFSRGWLVLAGVSWGLSLGSRLSLAVAVAALVVLTAFVGWRIRERRLANPVGSWVRGLKDLAWVGAPVLASLLLLGLYNLARFGSWTETGMTYQLTNGRFIWKSSFIYPNLYSYFLRPLKVTCRFPFLDAPQDWTTELPKWLRSPADYSWHESSAGIFLSAPWTCLALIALLYLGISLVRPTLRRWVGFPSTGPVNWIRFFCITAALIMATAPTLASLGLWLATMRYQVDYCSGLMFLGTIGCWLWVHRLPWRSLRTAGVAVCAFIGAASLIMGLLLGFRGYYNQFERNNPRLYKELSCFNFCSAESSPDQSP